MKFIIGVDCEGVACATSNYDQSIMDDPMWPFIRRQATREASAAAEALFEAGAERVIVWDNHWKGSNLEYELLDERCEIACGASPRRRWPGMDESFSGVLMVGYHAMDNTPQAILAHSYSSRDYQWIKVNGTTVGEMEIDAALAGEKGVPTIFVSSDNHGAAEAKSFMPWLETVATKQGIARHQAVSLHPNESVRRIAAGVTKAVERLAEMKPFTFDSPITLEYRFKTLDQAERAGQTGWERTDPYTCIKKLSRISDEY
jgi:D-amino peptidase